MWKEGCQIELCLYDSSKWWSFLAIFKSVSVAVKYDTGKYVIFEGSTLKKVKEDKILKRISHREIKPIECRAWYIGKIWLDTCIIHGARFDGPKEFAEEYIKVVRGMENAEHI